MKYESSQTHNQQEMYFLTKVSEIQVSGYPISKTLKSEILTTLHVIKAYPPV